MVVEGSAPEGLVSNPKGQRPVVLCLLDGIGEREALSGNAVRLADTKVIRELSTRFGKTILSASGAALGLREGEAGTGALAYEAIGTGRVPLGAKARIDKVIDEKKLGANAVVSRAMWIANDRQCRLHLFLPLGETSGHASMVHLSALLRIAEAHSVRVVVHVFLEERAGAPKSSAQRLEALAFQLDGIGTIATVSGESFALDRSGSRWEGAKRVFSAIVRGEASHKETLFEALTTTYEAGKTDGLVEPMRIGDYQGMQGNFMADFSSGKPSWEWFGEEVGLFMTHRPDRIHALAAMMARKNLPPDVEAFLTERGRAIHAFDEYGMLTLTDIDDAFEGVLAAFPSEIVSGTFGQTIASAGLSEARIATEDRAAHLMHFFDGRRKLGRTENKLVVTSEQDLADAAVGLIDKGEHDVVLVSLAAADRAAHLGNLEGTIAAVVNVDEALGRILKATVARGGALFVVGTHGSAEATLDDEGKPRGGHTTSPVPLFFAGKEGERLEAHGTLADVAPTVLEVLGLDKPAAMTGTSLFARSRV